MIKYNQRFIFIINDQFWGGHVKSFLAQFEQISEGINYFLICAKNGYIENNLDKLTFIKKEKISLYNSKNLRVTQFNIILLKIVLKVIKNSDIIHVYSYECYFSVILCKIFYKNIIILNSVMGGPNPFPKLKSTDAYLAVSEEQVEQVSKNNTNIYIIRNRISTTPIQLNSNRPNNIMLVSRFDYDKKKALERTAYLLNNIPETIKIFIIGDGNYLENFKTVIKRGNIEYKGYINNPLSYLNSCKLVIGMGRSILEFLLLGQPVILSGYSGIQPILSLEDAIFAAKFNFSARKVSKDFDIKEILNIIFSIIEGNNNFPFGEINKFIQNEYSVECFSAKYFHIIERLKSSSVNIFLIFYEYFNFNTKRLFRYLKCHIFSIT